MSKETKNMENKITAIIPTRSGSQRFKNKNIRPFAGSSLLQIKIDILKELINKKLISRVVVNTNCKKSMEIASQNDVEVIVRDNYYASSDCPITEYWEEVLTNGINTRSSMLCQVTSPLITIKTFEECIKRFNKLNCPIMTTEKIKDYIWRSNHNKIESVNYSFPKHPKSQDLNKEFFKINFGVVIIEKKDLLKYKNIMTTKTHCFFLGREESIDIDDGVDFKLAESIYKKNHS